MVAGHTQIEEIEEIVETETAVHVVLRVARDWDGDREEAVAETERKVARLKAFVASAAFRARFGGRTGVLRLRTQAEPPSIVGHFLKEDGVEIEVEDRPRADPGTRCALCPRDGLWDDQVAMTETGWACPSCFRAWSLRQEGPAPRGARTLSAERYGSSLRTLGFLCFLLLCLYGAYWTLDRMNQMSQVIRSTVPSAK